MDMDLLVEALQLMIFNFIFHHLPENPDELQKKSESATFTHKFIKIKGKCNKEYNC